MELQNTPLDQFAAYFFLAEITFWGPLCGERRRFKENKKCIFGTVSTTLLWGAFLTIKLGKNNFWAKM